VRTALRIVIMVLAFPMMLHAQQALVAVSGTVTDHQQHLLQSVTVSLFKEKDSVPFKITATSRSGYYTFEDILPGKYQLAFTATGFSNHTSPLLEVHEAMIVDTVRLQPAATTLGAVVVTSKKPFVELKPDRTIINVDASVTNAGATALEVLEKSPGVMVDKDGNISLKGRQQVLILIDGKQSYLPAADLSAMLSSMSASQIEQIEIISNPSAKYDASGSAGVISIRTKKLKLKGFNGSAGITYGQGVYPKNSNNLQLNYRNGKFNLFLNYTFNVSQNFTDLYAFRKYYEEDEKTVIAMLEQPTYITGKSHSHTLKTGLDYYLSKKTTLGLTLTGFSAERKSNSDGTAIWMDAAGTTDSIITTNNTSSGTFKNAAANFNVRHSFDDKKELTANVDYLNYDIVNNQFFQNQLLTGIDPYVETTKGNIPSHIRIFSAKADYEQQFANELKIQAGLKGSNINTDNLASYYFQDGNQWKPDYGKTNHFLYHEKIYATYFNIDKQLKRWTLQGGLRFEATSYSGEQRGNPLRPDSLFTRNYSGLFPTTFVSYKMDSVNTFSFSAGRRIDRPPFQKLNPFVFVINKYTYEQGNPFIVPQYTWNFELTHMFKDVLVTTLNYGLTRDYFSQIFYADSNGIIYYTEGNLGRMRNVGINISSQMSPISWWSITLQAGLYDKKIEGFVLKERTASLTTFNLNVNNQFRFNHGWSAELSGVYTSSEQELQEITDPIGQVSAGVAKQVMKNKGTIKLTVRDIFYTQAMKGNTTFNQATEYFKLTRDSRVCTVGFTYRFGKPLKGNTKKSGGGASEEIERISL
jgi:iron complex outermembrane recepter protein